MTTSESSKLRPKAQNTGSIRCAVRHTYVEATPEERVRQDMLHRMVDAFGFPKNLITVEKALKELPHLTTDGQSVPERRADILVFAKNIHPAFPLYPLLLIECKAVKLTPAVFSQVAGYNFFIKAFFVAVANQEEVRTGWFDSQTGSYRFVPFLPSYQSLIASVCQISHF